MSTAREPTKTISLPVKWPLFVLVPVVPFVAAAAVLELVMPGTLDPDRFRNFFAGGLSGEMAHLGHRLTYAAMAYVQVVTCLVVIGYYVTCIAKLDPSRRRGAYRIFAAGLLGVGLAVVAVRNLHGAAYNLTFENIRDLLRLSKASQDVSLPAFHLSAIPYLADVTPIALAVGLPFLLGVLAVVTAVPVSAAAASFDGSEEAPWQDLFTKRVESLQRALYALAAVLVTSTLALLLFFQLPAGLAGEELRSGLLQFSLGLTLFWGAVMTMTLIAVFAPAVLALERQAQRRHHASGAEQPFREWLAAQVPLSARRQLANVAAVLGPVLVSPIGGLVQSALGAS